MALGSFILFLSLLVAALAGPISWDDSKCSTSCPTPTKLIYKPRKSYIYKYESKNRIFIAGTADETDIIIRATAEIGVLDHCEMSLQLRDVFLDGAGVSNRHHFKHMLEADPLPFAYHDGQIISICPSSDEAVWVTNIKRGILSALQNSMKSFSSHTRTSELDISGICNTEYKMQDRSLDSFTVVKTKDLRSCQNRHGATTSIFSNPYTSPGSPVQNIPILDGKHNCKQTVDRNQVITEAVCEETNSFIPFSQSDKGAHISSTIYLYLSDIEDGVNVRRTRISSRSNLLYAVKGVPQKKLDHYEAVDIIREIVSKLKDDVKPEVPNLFTRLVYILRNLSHSSVIKIYNYLKSSDLRDLPKAMDVFLDSLPMAGSEGAIKVMIDFLKNNSVTGIRAKMWKTAFSFYKNVSEESVEACVPLLLSKNDVDRATLFGVSSMVHTFCLNVTSCAENEAVKKVIEALHKHLGYKCRVDKLEDEDKVIAVLKAFGNLGETGEATDDILECAQANRNSISLRIAALEAFRRSPCEDKMRETALELFEKQDEDTEVRIASYLAAMKCGNKEVVEKVKHILEGEKINQVGAFVWTHLTNLQETSAPHKQDIRDLLSDDFLTKKFSTDIRKFSNNVEWSFFFEKHNIGAELEINSIYNPKSFLPRSGSFNLTVDLFGHSINLFEIGGRISGLDHYVEKLFGPQGYFSETTFQEVVKDVKQNTVKNVKEMYNHFKSKRSTAYKSEKFKLLDERVNLNTLDKPEVSMYLRNFGNEWLWMNSRDIKNIYNIQETFSLVELMNKLSKKSEIDLSHSIMLLDTTVTCPTLSGIPVKIDVNGTATVVVKADGEINFPKMLFEGYISPSVAVEFSAAITMDVNVAKPGLKIVSTMHSSTTLDGKLEVNDKRMVNLKLNLPREKLEVINIKSELFLIHSGDTYKPIIPEKSLNFDSCTTFLGKPLGIEFCGKFTVPHPLFNSEYPYLPLNGPMEMEFSVLKKEYSMHSYDFTFKMPTVEATEDRLYQITFNTPGSSINREISLEIQSIIHKEASSVTFDFISPFKKIEALGSVSFKNNTHETKLQLITDQVNKYMAKTEVEINNHGNHTEMKPNLQILWPHSEPITLYGSIVYATGSKDEIKVDLKSNKLGKKSPYIRGNIMKEGSKTFWDFKTFLQLSTDVSLSLPYFDAHLYGTVKKEKQSVATDLTIEYQNEGQNQHSIKVNSKVLNLGTSSLKKYKTTTEVQFSQYPEYNWNLSWDSQYKQQDHSENDLKLYYGDSLPNKDQYIHLFHVANVKIDQSQGLNIETGNVFQVTAPAWDIDYGLNLTTDVLISSKIKYNISVVLKYDHDKHLKLTTDYEQKSKNPLKIYGESTLEWPEQPKMIIRNLIEGSNGEYKGQFYAKLPSEEDINVGYTYRCKSRKHKSHNEIEATIETPGMKLPLHYKGLLRMTRNAFNLESHTKYEGNPIMVVDVKLARNGPSEVRLNFPFLEGSMRIQSTDVSETAKLDFHVKPLSQRSHRSHGQRILGSVTYTRDPSSYLNNIEMDISWDANRNPSDKLAIKIGSQTYPSWKSNKYILWAKMNYKNDIFVNFSGDANKNILEGPHNFELGIQMKNNTIDIVTSHSVAYGIMKSNLSCRINYKDVIKVEVVGEYNNQGSALNMNGGISVVSPYEIIDGKKFHVNHTHDFSPSVSSVNTEILVQSSRTKGYNTGINFIHNKGWSSGNFDARAKVTTPHEDWRSQDIKVIGDYTSRSFKVDTDITLGSGNKIHMNTKLEKNRHGIKLVSFISTPYSTFYMAKLKAQYSFRPGSYLVETVVDVNNEKQLKVGGKFDMSDWKNFNSNAQLETQYTPSYNAYVRANSSGAGIGVDVGLKKDETEVASIKIIKVNKISGFNANLVFNYDKEEVLNFDVINEIKGKDERLYELTVRGSSFTHFKIRINSNISHGEFHHVVHVCSLQEGPVDCIILDGFLKMPYRPIHGNVHYEARGVIHLCSALQLSVDFLIHTDPYSYESMVVFGSNNKKLGYEAQIQHKSELTSKFKIFLTSRTVEIHSIRNNVETNFEIITNVERDPSNKLTINIQNNNEELFSEKFQRNIIIKHPELRRPVVITLQFDNEGVFPQLFFAKVVVDYSNNPSDKIIGEVFLEAVNNDVHNRSLVFNLYRADRRNFDIKLKLNFGNQRDRETNGFEWEWTDQTGEKKKGFTVVEFDQSRKLINFWHHCPIMSLNAIGKYNIVPNKELNADFNIEMNSQDSKAHLMIDYRSPSIEITTYDFKGSPVHRYRVSLSSGKKSLFSAYAESFNEGLNTTDVSVAVDHLSNRVFDIHFNWKVDLIAKLLIHLSTLPLWYETYGLSKIPLELQHKISLITQPLTQDVIHSLSGFYNKEFTEMYTELRHDFSEEAEKIGSSMYTCKLPSTIINFLDQVFSSVDSYTRFVSEYFIDFLHEYFWEWCSYGSWCYKISYAYQQEGLKGLGELVYMYFPDYMEDIDEISTVIKEAVMEVVSFFTWDSVKELLSGATSHIIETVSNSLIGETTNDFFEFISNWLCDKFGEMKYKIKQHVNDLTREITSNSNYGIFKEMYQQIKRQEQNQHWDEAWEDLKNFISQILLSNDYSDVAEIHEFDPERGEMVLRLNLPIDTHTVRQAWAAVKAEPQNYSYIDTINGLSAGIRKDWIGPYAGHGMLVGSQHFVTFDKTFYDFASECSYLVARDFADGNFSIIVSYKGKTPETLRKSIIMETDDHIIEIKPDDKMVTLDGQVVELPLILGHVTVMYIKGEIVVDNKHGITVSCHLERDFCSVVMSGWYFSKTAGLLGTYDNEPFNDMYKPKGHIAQKVRSFARSWELERGCRTRNIAQDEEISKNSRSYQMCEQIFQNHSSSLRPCFGQVSPDEYFKMCLRHMSSQTRRRNPQEALCNVAAAYVKECQHGYVSILMPSVCLSCQLPHGQHLEYDTSKKLYSDDVPKSSDVVFIIEEKECNHPIIRDIQSIVNLIERELRETGMYKNRYGVVGFGGEKPEQNAHVHTARGQDMFEERDIILATEKINLNPGRREDSDTFDAIHFASQYPFRPGVSKILVLMSCSPCRENSKWRYAEIQHILLHRGITLHILTNGDINIKGSFSKGRGIYGVDADTVYSEKDIIQKELTGRPELRSQVAIPKDMCIAMAQEVHGSFFSTREGYSKTWKSLLARRLVKSANITQCQDCRCEAGQDYVAKTVCQPCNSISPKVPFTLYSSDDEDTYF